MQMKKKHRLFPVHLCAFAIALSFALCFSFTAPAYADCDPDPDTFGSSAFVSYNPFSSAPTQAQLDFIITNDGTSTCDLEIDLVSSSGKSELRKGGKKLSFTVVNSGGWGLNPSGKILTTLDITIPAGQSQILTASFEIAPEQIEDPGNYSVGIGIDVFDKDLGSKKKKNIVSSNDHDFTAQVLSHVEARVSETSGNYGTGTDLSVLDVGVLETNSTHDIYLQIRGNTDAQVYISSQNGGVLKNTTDPGASSIDYTLRYRNTTYSMSSPIQVSRNLPSSLNGVSDRLRYKIGNTDGKLGGLYRDTFNVTVNAF